MPLPATKSVPTADLSSIYMLIYGPPGIGKSTLASSFPSPVFFTTERAHRHLSIYDRPIASWEDFKAAVLELKTRDGQQFKNVVVDTVDLLFKMCVEQICKQQGIDHPQDAAYGKGYDLVNTAFQREVVKLSLLRRGIIFVSHSKEAEVTSRSVKYHKTVPSMPAGCHRVILPFVDVECCLGFSEVDVKKRAAIFEPRESVEAKDRFGRFPAEVLLPKTGQYDVLVRAWQGNVQSSVALKKTAVRKT